MIQRACLLTGLLLVLNITTTFSGEPDAAITAELYRIEDLRLLHRFTIQELHDAKGLAVYLEGFRGPRRGHEVESLIEEAEALYLRLRGVDHGASGLLATRRSGKGDPSKVAPLGLVQRGRAVVAAEVIDHYDRTVALKADLKKAVIEKAREKTKWEVTSEPAPWTESALEVERKAGLPRGITLEKRFFELGDRESERFLAKAARTGLGYAFVKWDPACNWAELEKEKGKYDFTQLDALMSRLERHGMRACLRLKTLTGTPPEWHRKKEGDACQFLVPAPKRRRHRKKKGQPKEKLPEKIRSGINLFHADTRKAFTSFLKAYASHLKKRWTKNVDAVYVHATYEIGAVQDESEAMNAFWMKHSKNKDNWRKPETIAALQPFDEKAWVRAEMCREAWLLEYVRTVRESLKKGWKELTIQNCTTDDDFHVITRRSALSRDIYKLAALSDNPGTRTSSAAAYALLRSFGEGRPVWAFGVHAGGGMVAGADFGKLPQWGASRLSSPMIGRLVRLRYPLGWYRYPDGQLGDIGIGSYYLNGRRSQGSAPVLLNTKPHPAEIAILWSQSTFRLDRDYRWHNGALAFGHLLDRTFWPFDYVPEDTLAKRIGKYRLLVLPSTVSLPRALINVIREWVREGGILWGFGASCTKDEFGEPYKEFPLTDVFGARIAKMRTPSAIKPDNLETTHSEGSFTFSSWPRAYRFKADRFAVLESTTGNERAFYASGQKEVAIVLHTFGKGKTIFSGFPFGHEYYESARYEVQAGGTHHRHSNYNKEQKRYEWWISRELDATGLRRPLHLPEGSFLRAQRTDDPDWTHAFRDNPEYNEFMFERDRPVRSVTATARIREGTDNLYACLANTQFNYMSHLGYFRSTLLGGFVTARARVADPRTAVVFDVRLGVPVPSRATKGTAQFKAWVPTGQSAVFAVAPQGKVRLFGAGKPTGIGPEQLRKSVASYAEGAKLAPVEILDVAEIRAYIEARKEKGLWIACGTKAFRPVGVKLAKWLKEHLQIDARVTLATQRMGCRYDYMDSFGWGSPGGEPVLAQIAIGHTQSNGLMRRYNRINSPVCWLPLQPNRHFPGMGRAFVSLSLPAVTETDGRIRTRDLSRQLVIGASYPGEAMRAVAALIKAFK